NNTGGRGQGAGGRDFSPDPRSLTPGPFFFLFALLFILMACDSGNNGNFSLERVKNISTSVNICSGFSTDNTAGGTNIKVSGQIRYEDKEFDQNGFTGNSTFKPVRFADIEVVRCSDSTVIASGRSDSNGSYAVTFSNSGSPGIYIRVIGRTTQDTDTNIADIVIKSDIKSGAIQSVISDPFDESIGKDFVVDLDSAADSKTGGVFNILDVFTDGSISVTNLDGNIPPLLTVYWKQGNKDGTYFDSFDNSIHVLGTVTDTDEYDDDIILHEYAHFIAINLSKDDSPGDIHFLNENNQDIRLSWSEGWATFFANSIRQTPIVIDTRAVGTISFNIEIPDFSSAAIYSTNELAVTTVLWDIFDPANETFDTLSEGITEIWDIFSNYLPDTTDVSIEDFWDKFISVYPDLRAGLLSITDDRKMVFSSDQFEGNSDNDTNTGSSITIDENQTHNLYSQGASDIDYIKFSAIQGTTYTITTSNLSNGADTYLEVIDPDGTTVKSANDNSDGKTYSLCVSLSATCPVNDNTTLSSSITFTADTTGTYFVKISRSPDAPPSSGSYGVYDIKIVKK
ncbi:MAG: PPC domain-containing protein, partial [Nitrospirota bacterium]